MSKIAIATRLVKIATAAVKLKMMKQAAGKRREVCRGIHCKQQANLEEELAKALAPMFEKQIKTAAKRLRQLKSTKSSADNSSSLARQIFKPNEWDKELIDRALPVLARAMVEAVTTQLRMMGLDPKKYYKSTASEWLDRNTDEQLDAITFDTPQGQISMGFLSEFPPWVKDEIEDRLRETFEEDFWTKVNETTLDDIDGFLEEGLKQGWSIEKIAREMAPDLLEEGRYALVRGRRIARTESGHTLNGVRSGTIDKLVDDLGIQATSKKVWLSVLGTTTRRTHADLDGVPADKDGMWLLGGVRVPWPSHISLPVEERVNCQCSIIHELGFTDQEAQEVIAEYDQRLQEQEQEEKSTKHLPGQHSQSTHGRGGKLSAGEKSAVQSYTEAGYLKIRDCQNRRVGCDEKTTSEIDNLYSALDKLPDFEGFVFRGLSFQTPGDMVEFVSRLKNGEVVDRGFLSTSKSQSIAQGFTEDEVSGRSAGVFLQIKSKTGKDISTYSGFPEEEEVLMKPGTRFKFLGMSKSDAFDLIKVELEEI